MAQQTPIDPITLATTLNNPQSIAEALTDLLEGRIQSIETLHQQALTHNQSLNAQLTQAQDTTQQI